MKKNEIIKKTEMYIKDILFSDTTGHDWWHVYRVWQIAKRIGEYENVDMFIVEMASLLHDIADFKLHDGDDTIGPKRAKEWLQKFDIDKETINHIVEIIQTMSFKGANVESVMRSQEGRVVQDADRLDAMGAIGVGRAFTFGGFKNRPMYNPEIAPQQHSSFEAYKKNVSPTVNHFYEKLFLLKDLMNTEAAQKIAQKRHEFMEKFLEEFYIEWDCKDI